WQSPFVFRSNDAGAVLLLHADGKAVLVADSMSRGFCDAAYVDEVVAPAWYDGKHSAPPREAFLVKNVLDQIKQNRWRRIGLEFAQIPAGILQGVIQGSELLNIDSVLPGLKRS